VNGDELKESRKVLGCTAKELATTLGIEQAMIMAWEKGDLFPTKHYVDKIQGLLAKGPSAIAKKSKGVTDPWKLLADPTIWTLTRKLMAHKKFRDDVQKLAEAYPDPADATG
jgi:predicted transcriptional regulator